MFPLLAWLVLETEASRRSLSLSLAQKKCLQPFVLLHVCGRQVETWVSAGSWDRNAWSLEDHRVGATYLEGDARLVLA